MRTTILSVLAVAATLTPQLSAQTVASIEPGDRVRISSDEISGEFTVAAVQGETLSFQVFDTDADIREVILTDGERINLNGVQYELDGDDLVLRGADLEGGETDTVIRNWTAIPIRVRHIPLGQIREIVKDDSALGFHPASHAVQIPMTDVRKLEVSSRSAAAGALRGATWGILGGGVLGSARFQSLRSNGAPSSQRDLERSAESLA